MRATQRDATLEADLDALVEPTTRGDPQSPLRWTCKSTHKLAAELRAMGHEVSHETVRFLIYDYGVGDRVTVPDILSVELK